MSDALVAAGRVVTRAQPYPWPFHGQLRGSRSALVACLDPAWRSPRPSSDDADELLVELAGAMRADGALVVALTQVPPRAVGARSVTEQTVSGLEIDVDVRAAGTSGFYGSSLDQVLRTAGRSDLVFAGWGLEGPVHSTLRAANDRGYECLLASDACTPIDPELAFAASQIVRFSGGIFGAFTDTRDVIEAFGGAPTTEEAK